MGFKCLREIFPVTECITFPQNPIFWGQWFQNTILHNVIMVKHYWAPSQKYIALITKHILDFILHISV